jgi:hypothetical protein
MSLWRIRIAMSDDWRSQELLTEALAGQRVCSRLMSSHETEMSVDVIVELTDVDGLGTLLGELHMISPQVFVSSADQPAVTPSSVTIAPQRNVTTRNRRVPAVRRAFSQS